jgi:hypothetical protein
MAMSKAEDKLIDQIYAYEKRVRNLRNLWNEQNKNKRVRYGTAIAYLEYLGGFRSLVELAFKLGHEIDPEIRFEFSKTRDEVTNYLWKK